MGILHFFLAPLKIRIHRCWEQVYELEVHTTRGTAKRHRRFREFVAAHDALTAILRSNCGVDATSSLPELAKSWSSNSPAVTSRRVKELNSWLEAAILAVHAARTRVDEPSERAHALLEVFLCRADSVIPSDGPTGPQRSGDATAGSSSVDAASVADWTPGVWSVEQSIGRSTNETSGSDECGGSGAKTAAVSMTVSSDPLAEIQLMPVRWVNPHEEPESQGKHYSAGRSSQLSSGRMVSEARGGQIPTQMVASNSPSETVSGDVDHQSLEADDEEGQSGNTADPSRDSEQPGWNTRLIFEVAVVGLLAVVLAISFSGPFVHRDIAATDD